MIPLLLLVNFYSLHIFYSTKITGIKGLNKDLLKKLSPVSLRPKDTNKPSFQEKNANRGPAAMYAKI